MLKHCPTMHHSRIPQKIRRMIAYKINALSSWEFQTTDELWDCVGVTGRAHYLIFLVIPGYRCIVGLCGSDKCRILVLPYVSQL